MNVQKQKHPILSPCLDTCKRKCTSKLTSMVRSKIHDEFWSMGYNTQKQWLLSKFFKETIQRTRPSTSQGTPKPCSLSYKLFSSSGNEIQVCQTFLRTLGYSSNRVITELMKSSSESGGMNKAHSDMRGQHTPANKIDHSQIKKHIEQFNLQVSHYRREYAPNRGYITSETTLTNMFETFIKDIPG